MTLLSSSAPGIDAIAPMQAERKDDFSPACEPGMEPVNQDPVEFLMETFRRSFSEPARLTGWW